MRHQISALEILKDPCSKTIFLKTEITQEIRMTFWSRLTIMPSGAKLQCKRGLMIAQVE